MLLRLANGTPLSLSKQDFLTQGGEGRIYVRENCAYKIYTDPQKALCAQKFYELQHIQSCHVVTPTQLVYDNKGKIVGYQMPFISDAKPICNLFNLAYKRKNNITPTNILALITQLQTIIFGELENADCF